MPGRSGERNNLKREFFFWGLLLLVVAVDLGSKSMAFSGAFDGIPMLAGRVKNRGITFGFLSPAVEHGRRSLSPAGVLIAGLGILLVGFLLWFRYTHAAFKIDAVTALLAGGALGNIYDRLAFGYVRDFIRWPTFNLADVFICAGVLYFAVDMLYAGKERKESGKEDGKQERSRPG